MSKLSYIEVAREIDAFTSASHKLYGSYAYAAGNLGSRLALVIADLPRHKQMEIIESLRLQASEMNFNA